MSAADDLATEIADLRRLLHTRTIVYCTVASTTVNSATIDYDGVRVKIPSARCYGCNGALPGVGELVAVHVNGTELCILGRHL